LRRYGAPRYSVKPVSGGLRAIQSDRRLSVTSRGRLLVRTIAMPFDRHLREARERTQYSKVI
jgi:hypothetical protein